MGVMAIRNIPKNTNIFYSAPVGRDYCFKIKELKNLDPEILKMIKDFFCLEKNGTILIPECGLNGINISYFLNDSRHPNVKTIDGGFNFITTKKVKKGEELTVAYKTYDNIAESEWKNLKINKKKK